MPPDFYFYFTVEAHAKFTKEIPRCLDGENDITFQIKSEVKRSNRIYSHEKFFKAKKVELF